MPNKAEDFKPRVRVMYSGRALDRHGAPFAGRTATVIRPIKSRKVVHLQWDDPTLPTFESRPENLTVVTL